MQPEINRMIPHTRQQSGAGEKNSKTTQKEMEQQPSGTNSDKLTSAEAWQEVMDNVKTNHLYKPWKFSNPEVERTARQFGMAELCGLEMRDVNTARAQFMRMYDSAVSQSESDQENKEVLSLLGKKRYQALLSQVSMK